MLKKSSEKVCRQCVTLVSLQVLPLSVATPSRPAGIVTEKRSGTGTEGCNPALTDLSGGTFGVERGHSNSFASGTNSKQKNSSKNKGNFFQVSAKAARKFVARQKKKETTRLDPLTSVEMGES